MLVKRTAAKSAQLRRDGFQVVEMRECEFKVFCKTHSRIYTIRDKSRPTFARKHRGVVTENQILDGVVGDELFGMVEVDIEVPDQWHTPVEHNGLSPQEYFEEMCPPVL